MIFTSGKEKMENREFLIKSKSIIDKTGWSCLGYKPNWRKEIVLLFKLNIYYIRAGELTFTFTFVTARLPINSRNNRENEKNDSWMSPEESCLYPGLQQNLEISSFSSCSSCFLQNRFVVMRPQTSVR